MCKNKNFPLIKDSFATREKGKKIFFAFLEGSFVQTVALEGPSLTTHGPCVESTHARDFSPQHRQGFE